MTTITIRTQTFLHATGQLALVQTARSTLEAFLAAYGSALTQEQRDTFTAGGTIVVNNDSDVLQQSCIVNKG